MDNNKVAYYEEIACETVNQSEVTWLENCKMIECNLIRKKTRGRRYVLARYLCFYYLRKYRKVKLVDIANIYEKDHSTILYGINTLFELIGTDRVFRSEVKQFIRDCLKVSAIPEKNLVKAISQKQESSHVSFIHKCITELYYMQFYLHKYLDFDENAEEVTKQIDKCRESLDLVEEFFKESNDN